MDGAWGTRCPSTLDSGGLQNRVSGMGGGPRAILSIAQQHRMQLSQQQPLPHSQTLLSVLIWGRGQPWEGQSSCRSLPGNPGSSCLHPPQGWACAQNKADQSVTATSHCCLTPPGHKHGPPLSQPPGLAVRGWSLWPDQRPLFVVAAGDLGSAALPSAQGSAPCNRPTSTKASTQRSMSSSLCTAEIWTRIRALPLGTTG